jgi:hypothetical protein
MSAAERRRRGRNMRACARMLPPGPLRASFLAEVERTLTPEIDAIEARLDAAIKTFRRSRLRLIDGGRSAG